MRELEVRLALVCYGGASLAVYMNGITHEILKLVRASRAFQSREGDRETFEKAAPRRPYNTDTESLYFDLLQKLEPNIDIRVVVDVISGTSAGGLNGIYLARALAHDLDFGALRDMWMKLGDVEELMEQDTIADRFSKFYLHPFIWFFRKRIYSGENIDAESKRKLTRFLRSRWFQPPFSGERMLSWMVNACHGMGKPEPGKSLMPPSHRLDLFVSLTNFYGQPRWLRLHDPEKILERQHKVSLNFSYNDAEGQGLQSDFDDDNIPGLSFAARATSSFPGAFPPIRFRDLEKYLKKIGLAWPAKKAFFQKNFPHQLAATDKLETMSFIDGGVTNNKPFGKALEAIYSRSAHREIDRRVIYVDPCPDDPTDMFKNAPKEIPGFFRNILSALAEIPRNEPIHDDLRAIAEANKHARRMESIFETAEIDVQRMIDSILTLEDSQIIETAMLASWRERAHRMAQEKAGFTYGIYLQDKTQKILDKLAQLLLDIALQDGHRLKFSQTLNMVNQWATDKNILSAVSSQTPKEQQTYIKFLRTFDVDFRVKRLRFSVKKLNNFMQRPGNTVPDIFYKLTKQQIYKSLEVYRTCWKPDLYTEAIHQTWPDKSVLPDEIIGSLLETIGEEMQLEDYDFITDDYFALTLSGLNHEELKLTLFRAYIGYAFYDILTLPMTGQTDLLEMDEVRVDRISPLDAGQMTHQETELKGRRLFKFGAFFSRKARENDYLLGRIHAAHRLTDFILNAASPENVPDDFDCEKFKSKLVLKILDGEEPHMKKSKDLYAHLRNSYGAS